MVVFWRNNTKYPGYLDDVIEHLEKFGDTKLLRRFPRRIMRGRGGVEDTEHARPWMASNSSCEGTGLLGARIIRQALCKLALLDGALWRSVGQFYPSANSHA